MTDDETVLRRADGVLAQELDGEVLLLPLHTSQAMHLNISATAVWHAFDKPRSPEEVAQLLAHRFQTPVERLRADLRTVTDALLAGGALAREP